MRSMVFTVVLLFGAALNLSAQQQKSAEARNTDPVWERVGNIRPQRKIKAHLRDGKKLKGAFV